MTTILQINVTANSTSTGRIAEDVGRLVLDKGWRSVIAYGRWANPSKSELVRIGGSFANNEHWLESRLFDNHGLASRLPTNIFIERIKVLNPDIIHLHNVHGYYLNYSTLFRYLSSIDTPVVWTLHDCWSFTGHCAYFDYVKCEKWKIGCCAPCPCKHDYPKAILMDSSKRNWVKKHDLILNKKEITIVPVSDWLSDLVKKSYLGVYPIKVIKNGINLETFKPIVDEIIFEKYGIKGCRYVLGVANVWDRRKGLADYQLLSQKLPKDLKIVLVGLKKNQISEVEKYGIIGIPRTESVTELAALYSGAEMLANLTYEDNYPTTNLESMACGTPVLTYKTGGSIESVTKDTGWIVEQGNIEMVAEIAASLSENNKNMRICCRKRAEELFDKNKCFEEYIKLYESILRR